MKKSTSSSNAESQVGHHQPLQTSCRNSRLNPRLLGKEGTPIQVFQRSMGMERQRLPGGRRGAGMHALKSAIMRNRQHPFEEISTRALADCPSRPRHTKEKNILRSIFHCYSNSLSDVGNVLGFSRVMTKELYFFLVCFTSQSLCPHA